MILASNFLARPDPVISKTIIGCLGVIRKEGKILFALRHDPANKILHHKWEFPGGKIEPDELPQQALRREIMEEIGVEIMGIKPIGYYLCRFFKNTKIIFLPYFCLVKKGEPKPSNIEIDEVKWERQDNINPELCTPFTKDLLKSGVLK